MPRHYGYQQSTARWATRAAEALSGAATRPFWTDDAAAPAASPFLSGVVTTDLLIVGGGFAGLWSALQAKERDPGRRVVLIEGNLVGSGASGRNGGFVEASLTHGDLNGELHFARDMKRLRELGDENLAQIAETLARYGRDVELEFTGSLIVATEPYQVSQLGEPESGDDSASVLLSREDARAQLDSPLILGARWLKEGVAIVHPAKLVWALKSICEELGVQIFEHTPAQRLSSTAPGVTVTTPAGRVDAQHVILATNIYPSLLRRVDQYLVPVYDYVLMTEPLTTEQLASVGWQNRQGVNDMSNQFHYYRLSADNRILWGGYDAIYHFGGRVRHEYENRPATFQKLAEQFYLTFPQLADVSFSHKWGGAIDTCSRFAPFFGLAHRGRVAYVAGFTGLGVGSSRWAGQVLLDLLSGESTELTQLQMVRKKPIPFPPEPFAWPLIETTRRSMNRADANQGKRNLLLKAMDAAGVGFDS